MRDDFALPARLDLPALAGWDPRPPEFIVQGWIPAGEVTLFAGDGGTGKSQLALYLAVCVAVGLPFFDVPTQQRRVIFLSLEDPEPVLHWRLARICEALHVPLSDLAEWLTVIDGSRIDGALMTEGKDGAVMTALYDWLRETMSDGQVVIIDGASDAFDANENSRRLVRRFMRSLRQLIPGDGAVILLSHVDKLTARTGESAHGYSGSTAWSNSARSRLYLRRASEREQDGDLLLEVQKSNLGPTGVALRIRWDSGGNIFIGETTVHASGADRDAANEAAQAALVALIDDADKAGDPIPAAATGPRTAYVVLAARPGFPKTLKDRVRFKRAVEKLRTDGVIRVEGMRRPNRHIVEVLRVVK